MKKPPKNFCVMPFTSMVVRADGSVSACCENGESVSSADGEKLHLYKDRLGDAFGSPWFKELRRCMLAGERHPSCQSCWSADDKGLLSKRVFENRMLSAQVEEILSGATPGQPVDLSLNLGNQCNLKCRICGPTSSSRWAAEYLELFGEDHVPRQNRVIRELGAEASRALITGWPLRDPNFGGDLSEWLPRVKRFEFLGGEPFLNRKQYEIVRECAEKGYAGEQTLNFITNGSVWPEAEALEHWKKFRRVNVHVSVDGLAEQFEYQRYGAGWPEVTSNVARFRALSQVRAVNLMVTASVFNVFYLPELYAFWEGRGFRVADCLAPEGGWREALRGGMRRFTGRSTEGNELSGRINTSYVFNPHKFDVRVLPPALKRAVAEKFRASPASKRAGTQLLAVEAHMMSEDRSSLWLKTIESIWFHDQYRKQSFAKTFPEFHAEAKRLGLWFEYDSQPEVFFPERAATSQV